MVHMCIVRGCPTTSLTGKLHRIPKAVLNDESRRNVWTNSIGEKNLKKPLTPDSDFRICSLHFSQEAFRILRGTVDSFELKDNAVPLRSSEEPVSNTTVTKVDQVVPIGRDVSEEEYSTVCSKEFETDKLKKENELLRLQLQQASTKTLLMQKELDESKFCFENISKDEKTFLFYTGLSIQEFHALLDFLGPEANDLCYWLSPSNADRPNSYTKRGPGRSIDPKNELFLVLCRLKVGLLEQDIANRSKISQSQFSKIFTTWICFLYNTFKNVELWPSRATVDANMPQSIKDIYPSLRCTIDATEIYIEQPSSPEAQQLTFSSYKNHNTLKALIGISPSGSITFVSDLFGGNISDKELTIRSCILKKAWARGDLLMADRGFDISDLTQEIGVELNIPPFQKGDNQFTEQDLTKTRRIASTRIHVERAIERIKNHHILDFVPNSMCQNHLIDKIFFICTMLTNFKPPLISN